MKKWFAFIAIFISSYLVFLVASTPLALVINNVKLPTNIEIESASGSIWQGEISRVVINNNVIEQVKTDLSFWSLLSFSPSVKVTFGDAMLAGPEGKLTLDISSDQFKLSDVELFLSASDIAKQLPLPIPVVAQGNVELQLASMQIAYADKLSCTVGRGEVTWVRAGVVALEQNIKLGKLSAALSCDKGNILAKVEPKNNLGLSFDGTFALASKRMSGTGYLSPGTKFPAELRDALSFLGRPDNQGRYPLRF